MRPVFRVGIVALAGVVALGQAFGSSPNVVPRAAPRAAGERILPFPIVPVDPPSAGETAALEAALASYRDAGIVEAIEPLEAFLRAHPASPWTPTLRSALGVIDRQNGYLSRALDRFERSWTDLRSSEAPAVRAIADVTLGNLAELTAALGRTDRLRKLLTEVEGRRLGGYAAEQVSSARVGLAMMEKDPGGSFRCGPLAVEQVSRVERPGKAVDPAILAYRSSATGTSLAELLKLSKEAGLDLRAVHREGGEFVAPSVVHWKAGHFAALIAEQGGRYRVKDLTFNDDRWVSRRALDEETSGYMLVPASAAGKGFRRVSLREAATVRGQGATGNPNPGATTPKSPKRPKKGCGHGGKGMPTYDFHIAIVSLNVMDTPVGYTPPRGLAMNFGITYNSREEQPAALTFSNLGPRWTFDWLSYVEDQDPAHPGQMVRIAELGGGSYTETASAPYGPYPINPAGDHDRLAISLPNGQVTFTRTYPNGSTAVYSASDGASMLRKYFLTSISDPSGNTVTFQYDASTRLTGIVDALGQKTTIAYADANDAYRITKVTDPFGRSAALTYDENGMLVSTTDAIGMTSTFHYGPTTTSPHAPADFMNAMTTPYGTTTFDMDEYAPGGGVPGTTRWIQAVDPMGEAERVEFIQDAYGIAATTTDPVPLGMTNSLLEYRNTFYWDATAMQSYEPTDPDRYKKATTVLHWLHDNTGSDLLAASVPESVQNLGERRVWFRYPGQSGSTYIGSLDEPTTIARVLDSGEEQRYTIAYDDAGRPTSYQDPIGRLYALDYSADGIDLTGVRNLSASDETLVSVSYDSHHLPVSWTDYAGRTTAAKYNGYGQLASLTLPDGTVWSYSRDAQGYLTRVAQAATGFQEAYTYDAVGRTRTWTSTDGLTLTFDYDSLDRLTTVTYPDGSTETTAYDRLDPVEDHDRLGRVSRFEYDADGRNVSSTDPSGLTTRYEWCGCGDLDAMTDPGGHRVDWLHDEQGRTIARFSNGNLTSDWEFDSSGRLVAKTDAMGQTKLFSYNVDDTLAGVSYSNAVHSTPSVHWTWDQSHRRIIAVDDGTGTTTYGYVPAGSPGGGAVASIILPSPSHEISFSYDSVGRVVQRSIDGVSVSTTYDVLGRRTAITSPLGTATLSYDGSSDRATALNFPALLTRVTYGGPASGFAPATIQSWIHADSFGGFSYTWDPAGEQLLHVSGFGANTDYQYDPSQRLVSASQYTDVLSPGSSPPATTYGFDLGGNRTSESGPAMQSTATYDGENRLIAVHRQLNQTTMAAIRKARRLRTSSPRPGTRPTGGDR